LNCGEDENLDGFAKSPSAALRSSFVTAAYFYVRLIPQLSQALHLELFALPSVEGNLRDHQS
jgi:hypothetical protein